MATRYYLSNSAAAAVSPTFDAGWADSTNWKDDRKAMATAKSNSALTGEASNDFGSGTACTVNSAPGRILMRQWVGPLIGVFNFNGTTVSAVIKCLISGTGTAKLNLSVRLRHSDGTFTTLLAATAADYDTNIPTTAATRIVNAVALANVSSQNNDRLVVEIGANWSAIVAGCRTLTLTDGDPSATADYALTTALTTALDPWVEFSGTLPAPAVFESAFLSFFH